MIGGTDNIAIGKGGCVAGSMTFGVRAVDPATNVVYLAGDRADVQRAFTQLAKLAGGDAATYSIRLNLNFDNAGRICTQLLDESEDRFGVAVSCTQVPYCCYNLEFDLPGGSVTSWTPVTPVFSSFKSAGGNTVSALVGISLSDEQAMSGKMALLANPPLAAGQKPPLVAGSGEVLSSYVGKLVSAEAEEIRRDSDKIYYNLSVEIEPADGVDLSGFSAGQIGIPYSVPLGTATVEEANQKISEVAAGVADFYGVMHMWLPDYPGVGTIAGSNANAAFGYGCWATGGFSFATGQSCKSQGKHGFSFGVKSSASGYASMAAGQQCEASDNGSFALGYKAKSSHARAFTWSGNTGNGCESHGIGTFNIQTNYEDLGSGLE